MAVPSKIAAHFWSAKVGGCGGACTPTKWASSDRAKASRVQPGMSDSSRASVRSRGFRRSEERGRLLTQPLRVLLAQDGAVVTFGEDTVRVCIMRPQPGGMNHLVQQGAEVWMSAVAVDEAEVVV